MFPSRYTYMDQENKKSEILQRLNKCSNIQPPPLFIFQTVREPLYEPELNWVIWDSNPELAG